MSTASNIRPVFTSEVEEEVLSKPLSKIAMASLGLGIVSLVAPLASLFLPVAIVAALLGLIASISLASRNSTQTGAWMANVGLLLGLTCAIWSGISSKILRDRVAQQAADYSRNYLQLIANNELYKACELQLSVPNRQLPGLDLKEYYESYEGSISDETMHGGVGSPPPQAIAKRRVVDLRANSLVRYLQSNSSAKWNLDALLRDFYIRSNFRTITVLLSNSEKPSDRIQVTLERQEYEDEGKLVADWNIKSAILIQ